jgi:hypothetical protein
METYELTKWIWTEDDFELMGWHDATIHAIALPTEEFECQFDIDYIFQWVGPLPGEGHFRFWVAPATLVFENVYEVRFDIEPSPELTVQDLLRSEPGTPRNANFVDSKKDWRWTLECHQGTISFRACRFKQFIRQAPVFKMGQALSVPERGGYSFERGKAARRHDA